MKEVASKVFWGFVLAAALLVVLGLMVAGFLLGLMLAADAPPGEIPYSLIPRILGGVAMAFIAGIVFLVAAIITSNE